MANIQKKSIQSLVKCDDVQKRINDVLGKRANQFAASIISLVNSKEKLKACDPMTVLSACMTAATLDLPINSNLGFAHIVPYKDKAQFQMGYKGFIQLAMRTGQYSGMTDAIVNAEAFLGYDEIGEPLVDFSAIDESNPAVGYYFAFRMTSGFSKRAYWTKEKVEAHAKRYSQAYKNGYDTPWKDNFNSMALKTVIKLTLGKWGYLSVDLQTAMEADQSVVDDNGYQYPDNGKATIEAKAQSVLVSSDPNAEPPVDAEVSK